jgi:hypothetical protein
MLAPFKLFQCEVSFTRIVAMPPMRRLSRLLESMFISRLILHLVLKIVVVPITCVFFFHTNYEILHKWSVDLIIMPFYLPTVVDFFIGVDKLINGWTVKISDTGWILRKLVVLNIWCFCLVTPTPCASSYGQVSSFSLQHAPDGRCGSGNAICLIPLGPVIRGWCILWRLQRGFLSRSYWWLMVATVSFVFPSSLMAVADSSLKICSKVSARNSYVLTSFYFVMGQMSHVWLFLV